MSRAVYLNTSSTAADKNNTFNFNDPYFELTQSKLQLQGLKAKIIDIVHAPIDSKIIFTSGATEAIATCVNWAKSVRPNCVIQGSSYDHPAVKRNCLAYNIPYKKNLLSGNLDDRVGMIFYTQVNPKTGELMDIDLCTRNLNRYAFMEKYDSVSLDDIPGGKYLLQYEPIRVLDASQSIMKVPIYMDKWNLNAVFFSMHKIGGKQGLGVLVVHDSPSAPFVPLIAGSQQDGLRGGTMPIMDAVADINIFDDNAFDDYNERISRWKSAKKELEREGLKVYEPKGKHLYNTLLIDCGSACADGIIYNLSQKGIFVGNKTTCKSVDKKSMKGGNAEEDNKLFKHAVRLSFNDSSILTDNVLNDVAKEIIMASGENNEIDDNVEDIVEVDDLDEVDNNDFDY